MKFRFLIFLFLINASFFAQAKEDAVLHVQPNLSEELKNQFDSLSEKEQVSFLEKREKILSGLETTLQKTRWGFYLAGSLARGLGAIKDYILYDSLAAAPSAEIKEMIRIDKELRPEKYQDKNLSERTAEIMQAIVLGTDMKLWSQSALVANSNQFSFIASAAIQAQGGTKSKKWGGLYDLGFSIGYNTESKAVIVQIFRNREKFEHTLMGAIGVGGIIFKLGPEISNENGNGSKMSKSGGSFYPPMLPGFQTTTKDSYAFGFSSGLTWPPSPIADILTYTNTLDQKVILKLSFSKTFTGFVRVKMNLKSDTLVFAQEKLADLFSPYAVTKLCSALF